MVLVHWIPVLSPLPKQSCLPHCGVVVNLVSTTNHDMKWTGLVRVQDVAPQGVWATKLIRIDTSGESVAAVKHDIHRFSLGRDPESNSRTLVDFVGDAGLASSKFDFDVEAPECHTSLSVQTNTRKVAHFAQLFAVSFVDTGGLSSRPIVGASRLREQACAIFDARQVFILGELIDRLDVQRFARA